MRLSRAVPVLALSLFAVLSHASAQQPSGQFQRSSDILNSFADELEISAPIDIQKQQHPKRTHEEIEAYKQLVAFATYLKYADLLYPKSTHQSDDAYFEYPNNWMNAGTRRSSDEREFVPSNADEVLKKDESAPVPAETITQLEKLLNFQVVQLYATCQKRLPEFVKVLNQHPDLNAKARVRVEPKGDAFMQSYPAEDKVPHIIETNPAFLRSVLLALPSVLVLLDKQLSANVESRSSEPQLSDMGPRELAYNNLLLYSLLRGSTPLSLFPNEDGQFRTEAFLGEFAFRSVLTFVLAHEIGHIVLGHFTKATCEQSQQHELEADAFATVMALEQFGELRKQYFEGFDRGYESMFAEGMSQGHRAFFEIVYGLAGFDRVKQSGCQYPTPAVRLAASETVISKAEDEVNQ